MPTPEGMQRVLANPKAPAEVKAAAQKWLAANGTAQPGGGGEGSGGHSETPEEAMRRQIEENSRPDTETAAQNAADEAERGALASKREQGITGQDAMLRAGFGVNPMATTQPPATREAPRFNPLSGKETERSAALGDPKGIEDLAQRERQTDEAATLAAALATGPAGKLAEAIPALAKAGPGLASWLRMGLSGGIGGAVGGGVKSVGMGAESPGEVAKDAATSGGVSTLLSLILGLPGALGKSKVASLRTDPMVGKDVVQAERGGFQTNMSQGMKGPKPLGPQAADAELSRVAEKDILPAVQTVDKAIDASARTAQEPLLGANPAPKADLRPYSEKLHRLLGNDAERIVKGGSADPAQLEDIIGRLQDHAQSAKQYGKSAAAAEASALQRELQALRTPEMQGAKAAYSTEIKKVRNIKQQTGVTNTNIDDANEAEPGLAKTLLPTDTPKEAVIDSATIGRMKGKLGQVGKNTQVTEQLDALAARPDAPPGVARAVEDLKSYVAAERVRAASGSGNITPPTSMAGVIQKAFSGGRINRDPAYRWLAENAGIPVPAVGAVSGQKLGKKTYNKGRELAERVRGTP